MPPLLTSTAVITCCHGTGRITVIPSQSTVLIAGAPALVAGDIAGAPVVGCAVPPSPASKPCTTATVPPAPGVSVSARVLIAGRPAMLGTPALPGVTDAAPVPCPVVTVMSPGQLTVQATA